MLKMSTSPVSARMEGLRITRRHRPTLRSFHRLVAMLAMVLRQDVMLLVQAFLDSGSRPDEDVSDIVLSTGYIGCLIRIC